MNKILKPIKYDKKFLKNLYKRFSGNKKLEKQLAERVNIFLKDKGNPLLKDHKLIGSLKGVRAFSITGDIRIIYQEVGDYYIFIDIGTHNQVY